MNNVNKASYEEEPVYYCRSCLSLKIIPIQDEEFCDLCGSTDIGTALIEEWEKLYESKYGHKYIIEDGRND